MSTPDPAKLCDIAVSVARETGEMLASRAGQVEVAATKSSPTDVVTEMDRRAEALIRSRILAARPDDAILGEEEGQTGDTAGAPARWVVDPLDGTVNYLYGLPDWAVSIAVEVGGRSGQRRGGRPEDRGGRGLRPGSRRDVQRVRRRRRVARGRARRAWPGCAAAQAVPLRQALVGTGFGYLPARRQVQGEVVAALLPRLRDIRRIGVASVDLCAVAAGRLDGFYERGLNYWDWAAGALVASEAGAIVGGLRGAPLSSSMAVAAGPALFGPLTEALAELDPERDA